MRASRSLRLLIGTALLGTSVLASAATSFAHVGLVTYGTTFTAGKTNVIYFRVPHGCPDPNPVNGYNARTTAVEVQLPAGAVGAKPEQKPGWDVQITKDGTGLVTSIKWTARDVHDSLADWTYGDFGVRATLNGTAGTVLTFPTTQYCDAHDDYTSATGLTEVWSGANAPKLTLVDPTASGVQNAADLATVKGDLGTAKTTIAAHGGDISSLGARVDALEAAVADLQASLAKVLARVAAIESSVKTIQTTGRLGFVTVTKGSNQAAVLVDLPTTMRWHDATLQINGRTVAPLALNGSGDASLTLGATRSAALTKGQKVEVVVAGAVVAIGTVR